MKAKRLWDITDEAGMLTGVYGYLATWPVTPISGFVVPGWTAQGNETWPPELSFIKQLERSEKAGEQREVTESLGIGLLALRNGVTLATLNEIAASLWRRRTKAHDEERTAAENRQIKLSFNTDIYCHLLRTLQPEFSIFYDSAIDATQHLFFKYFEPAGFPSLPRERIEMLGDVIPTIYRRADVTLGRIRENADSNANFVIVSDHGQEVDAKGLLERLRHHRVGQHRENRAGGERLDRRREQRWRPRQEGIAEPRRHRADEHHGQPQEDDAPNRPGRGVAGTGGARRIVGSPEPRRRGDRLRAGWRSPPRPGTPSRSPRPPAA